MQNDEILETVAAALSAAGKTLMNGGNHNVRSGAVELVRLQSEAALAFAEAAAILRDARTPQQPSSAAEASSRLIPIPRARTANEECQGWLYSVHAAHCGPRSERDDRCNDGATCECPCHTRGHWCGPFCPELAHVPPPAPLDRAAANLKDIADDLARKRRVHDYPPAPGESGTVRSYEGHDHTDTGAMGPGNRPSAPHPDWRQHKSVAGLHRHDHLGRTVYARAQDVAPQLPDGAHPDSPGAREAFEIHPGSQYSQALPTPQSLPPANTAEMAVFWQQVAMALVYEAEAGLAEISEHLMADMKGFVVNWQRGNTTDKLVFWLTKIADVPTGDGS